MGFPEHFAPPLALLFSLGGETSLFGQFVVWKAWGEDQIRTPTDMALLTGGVCSGSESINMTLLTEGNLNLKLEAVDQHCDDLVGALHVPV